MNHFFNDSGISIHAPRVGCDDHPNRSGWPSRNFNPRTPCGVRPLVLHKYLHLRGISIHAPRVGCDRVVRYIIRNAHIISIHAPRVGCDAVLTRAALVVTDFNPRTPCGVRPIFAHSKYSPSKISIHAPRVGCDAWAEYAGNIVLIFQSTHPVWGATAELAEVGEHFPRFQSTHPVWGATPWPPPR